MSNIRIYSSVGSCSMVALALLNELDIPYEDFRMQVGPNGIEAVDGSMDREAYLKIHPSGYVPALSVDGQVITENPAIFRYISLLKPERHILGRTLIEQVRVEEWLVWLSGTVHGYGFAGLWKPARFIEEETMEESVKTKAMQTILACFDRIEKKIVGPFALGEEWFVPDVFLHTFWRWGNRIGVSMSQYPKWRQQIEAIEKTGGLRKAMKDDGIDLFFP